MSLNSVEVIDRSDICLDLPKLWFKDIDLENRELSWELIDEPLFFKIPPFKFNLPLLKRDIEVPVGVFCLG